MALFGLFKTKEERAEEEARNRLLLAQGPQSRFIPQETRNPRVSLPVGPQSVDRPQPRGNILQDIARGVAVGAGSPLSTLAATFAANRQRQGRLGAGFAADIARSPVRTATSVGLEAPAALLGLAQKRKVEPVFTPSTRFQRAVFGDKPIEGIFKRTERGVQKTREFLGRRGVDPETSLGISLAAAPIGFAGSVLADLSPVGGGRKKAGQVGADLVKRYGDDSVRFVRQFFDDPSLLSKTVRNDIAQQVARVGQQNVQGFVAGVERATSPGVLSRIQQSQVSKEVIPTDTKYVGAINRDLIARSPAASERLTQAGKEIEEVLSVRKGAPVTHAEVETAAQKASLLTKVITRGETVENLARMKATRNQLSERLLKEPGISKEMLAEMQVVSSQATDMGRALNALSSKANPNMVGVKEALLRDILKVTDDFDKIIDASKGVDFDDPRQVTELYRKFVQPTRTELIDEMRYINLLSSPNTHSVNIFSNALQAGIVAPTTRVAEGLLDLVRSKATGTPRQVFPGEAASYIGEAVNALPQAMQDARQVLKGQKFGGTPDLAFLPTGSRFTKPFLIVPRALSAMDKFFTTVISAGEFAALSTRSKKLGTNFDKTFAKEQADAVAEYYVFRQGLKKEGQGPILETIDKFTALANQARNIPGVKWMIPFITTPTNILKQGLEYSPAGLVTLPGAANKQEQLAKAFVGSTVFAGAAQLVSKTDSTWAAPRDPEAKAAFYDSGRQPYSIRIGDEWVSYSRLGPLSFPIAMAASWKFHAEQDPDRFDDEAIDRLGKTILSMGEFWTDQSYLKGINTLLNLFDKGHEGQRAWQEFISAPVRQLTPLSSLVSWVNRTFVDMTFRKPRTALESVKIGIPVLSKQVEPILTSEGLPAQRKQPRVNALLPFKVSPAIEGFEDKFLQEQGARNFFDSFNQRPKDEKNSVLRDLYQNDRSKYNALLREIKLNREDTAPAERDLLKLNVKVRAERIFDIVNQMQTTREKNEYLQRLQRSGVLSEGTNKAFGQLVGQRK